MMKETFKPLKTIQAVAFMLEKGVLPVHTVHAALYLADRKSLQETGSTITGSSFTNTAKGPQLYSFVEYTRDANFRYHIVEFLSDERTFSIIEHPGDGELSEYDCQLLEMFSTLVIGKSRLETEHLLKSLPEWRDPELSYEDVLDAMGVDTNTIRYYQELAAVTNSLPGRIIR
jgi:hypothetical protein